MAGNWMKIIDRHRNVINLIVLFFTGLSFVLSDWLAGPFSFGEYIIFFVLCIFLFTWSIYIKKNDIFLFIFLNFFVLTNIFLSEQLNHMFGITAGIAAFIKIIFYLCFLFLTYRYMQEFHLKEFYLKLLNILSVIVVGIGLYIVIAIYTESLPYKFFWTFTRSDIASYYFRHTVRMRSVFAEPAHLGYFLNMVLGLNFFTNEGKDISKWMNLILTIGVILTFSYSSIAIMVALCIMMFVRNLFFVKKRFRFNYKILLFLLIILIVVFLSRDFLYRTFVLRTIQIIQGEDGSALNRFLGSWSYINKVFLFIGNGAGNTPPVTNIYAYMLSDFGILAFLISVALSLVLVFKNVGVGIMFILLNFQKGGYLAPAFWVLVLSVIVFTDFLDYFYESIESTIAYIKRKFNFVGNHK